MTVTTRSFKEMASMGIRRSSRRSRRSWLGVLCAAAALAAFAPAAHADFGIETFTTTVTSNQAGGHPDLSTVVNYRLLGDGTPDGRNKDLTVDLPPGFLGNPQAVPTCPMSVLLTTSRCNPDSQVGVLTLIFAFGGGSFPFPVPVYHVDTQPGHAASFAAIALIPTVMINADIGPGHGYRLSTSLRDASEAIPLAGSQLDFWGVPADPSHDADRGGPADSPRKPFMIYPTNCSAGSLTATADATSWEHPGAHSVATTTLPAPTGCDQLSISPSLNVTPGTSQADSPSSYMISVHVPQSDDPDAPATPPLRRVKVTLPEGVALSPAGADGLAGCTDGQFAPSSDAAAACPDASKIGTVEIASPLQATPLKGSIYLGAPTASNPFRIFLTATGPGTLIKLIGNATPDANTGRLTTVFDDNPQLPFSDLTLTFFDGPRASLANPQTCGTVTATSELAAWSGQTATPNSSFTITGCGSPIPFAPDFVAGMTDSHAGGTGAFTLQIGRNDGNQNLSSVKVDLPPGLLAKVGSVPLCSDADANAGTCPDASQVGTVNVAAGSGGLPLWLGGKAYLTGPYKGAPFGLAVVVPAIAGPFNLGTVAVRQALNIDAEDAHVSVASDSFPTILSGIPLRLRRVAVTLDRPGFMLNPTNCDPLKIAGVVTSTGGAQAAVSTPFQVGGCAALGFSPKLALKLTGKRQTARRKHPGLVATLTPKAGQANLKSVSVKLPSSLTLDLANAGTLCEPADAARRACPRKSAIGSAKLKTPLLGQTLSGPAYFVKGTGGGLPKLLVALSGPIAINLHADSAVQGSRLVTTFKDIPDAPVTSFALTINGGSRGIFVNSRNLCSKKNVAAVTNRAQNGKRQVANVRMSVTCPKKKKRSR